MTTPNTQPTELDKAIERVENEVRLQRNQNGISDSHPSFVTDIQELLLAANRLKEVEKVNKAYSEVIGTNAETIFSLQQRLEEVEKGRDVEAKAYKDAIEILKEKHEELSELRTGYNQALEEVKIILNDYSSDLVIDNICRKILSTPLAIATMKGDQ